MQTDQEIIIAAKCAPVEEVLRNIEEAGITAVELYTSSAWLNQLSTVVETRNKCSLKYAIHAPNDCFEADLLSELVRAIKAEIVVFHDIFWSDEWKYIYEIFKNSNVKVCIENLSSIHQPLKYMRRYGFKRCLDIEHLQLECAGFITDELNPVVQQSSHIHLTGYKFGTNLWHTHIHCSPEHNMHILDFLKNAGFSGYVVSEASVAYQTLSEFKKLHDFFKNWEDVKY